MSRRKRTGGGDTPRLIIEPPGFVPLTPENRARAVAALRAVFVSYLLRHRAGGQDWTTHEPGGLLVPPTGREPGATECQRFTTEKAASSWFDAVLGELDGTTLLVAGATAPVWWPPEKESERPQWSRLGEPPVSRLGLFVNVWAEIIDPAQFFDYSVHYRWTVERAGGLVLVPGPKPFQQVLHGGPAPHAMALMAWPDEQTRHAWYHGPLYRPYRDQRHWASHTSNVSVRALSPHPQPAKRPR